VEFQFQIFPKILRFQEFHVFEHCGDADPNCVSKSDPSAEAKYGQEYQS
jgi:hypothetical protein